MPNRMQSLLSSASGDELHALCDNICTGVFDQQVNVVRRDDIIENAKTITLLRLEHPMQVAASVARKL